MVNITGKNTYVSRIFESKTILVLVVRDMKLNKFGKFAKTFTPILFIAWTHVIYLICMLKRPQPQ